MNKQISITTAILTLLLAACSSGYKPGSDSLSTPLPDPCFTVTAKGVSNHTIIPDIQLPLKIRCDDFPGVRDPDNFHNVSTRPLTEDISTYFGKIARDNLTILIKNKKNIQSPILYTLDKNGCVVDTLVLFDRLCYIGTDSYYLPWIEITKDLTVARTDTSYYSQIKYKEFNEITTTVDTTITIEKFSINTFGRITKTK